MIALRRGRRETSLPPKSIVLVHGGFFDGSVYHILKKHGFEVIVVQNPTIPLANDVAVTKQTIAAAKGDVVLVGLSLRRRRCVGGGQRSESHRLDLVRMKRSPRNYRIGVPGLKVASRLVPRGGLMYTGSVSGQTVSATHEGIPVLRQHRIQVVPSQAG